MAKNIIALIFFLSCSLIAQIEQDEFINPGELGIPNELDIKDIQAVEEKNNNFEQSIEDVNLDNELVLQRGFRIQLISTQDVSMAESVETKAIELFEDEVYLVFEYPNYKVRVGNFLDIKETRTMERMARRNGFPRAWTVPSEVLVKNTNERY